MTDKDSSRKPGIPDKGRADEQRVQHGKDDQSTRDPKGQQERNPTRRPDEGKSEETDRPNRSKPA